jgi:hypothetical protein
MIALKDNWKLPLSFRELWRYLNRNARWWNGLQLEGGTVIHNENGVRLVPGSSGSGSTDFAWNVTGTGLAISVTPGDIELGPDTVIAWGDIDGASTSVSGVSWIWVNIDVADGAESAEMLSGSSITSLTDDEKKHICQKRIAQILTVDGITVIKRHQCGNIFIPRL